MSIRDPGNRFVMPALVLLSLVTVYPVLSVLYLSLHRRLLIFDISKFVGLDNYRFLASDDRFWNALRNTVYFTATSVSLELVLGLALALSYELADYAADLKHGRRTLMVRMGWQRAMLLHNGMILVAFLLLGLALSFGLPLFIGLPAFLPLPLGLLQVWQMRRISEGARPNWRALRLTAVVIFATTAYLLTFAFWTR